MSLCRLGHESTMRLPETLRVQVEGLKAGGAPGGTLEADLKTRRLEKAAGPARRTRQPRKTQETLRTIQAFGFLHTRWTSFCRRGLES